jgi:hypothetical protein
MRCLALAVNAKAARLKLHDEAVVLKLVKPSENLRRACSNLFRCVSLGEKDAIAASRNTAL